MKKPVMSKAQKEVPAKRELRFEVDVQITPETRIMVYIYNVDTIEDVMSEIR